MPTYYVRDNERHDVRQLRAVKGEAITVTVDFSPWADDNGAVTSVTWSVPIGTATVSGDAVSSSVATAVVTTAQTGRSQIQVKGTGATHTKVFVLDVWSRDPSVAFAYDYWWAR